MDSSKLTPVIRRLALTFVLALALSGLALNAAAQDYVWKERGYGGGGRFTAIAVIPGTPGQVFIGSDVAGYFVSRDNGHSFQIKGAGLEGFAVASITPDPKLASRLFILADDGLYVSDDAGQNVAKISGKIRYNSRSFGSRLILEKDGVWYAAANSDGVFKFGRAPDGSWTASPLFGLEGKKVNSLAVYKGRLTAATEEGVFYHDGEIWKLFNDGLPSGKKNMQDIAAHPSGRLYAVEKQTGLYVFDDAANKWEKRGVNPSALPSQSGQATFKAVAVSPDNPDLVLLATHAESWPHILLRSQDGGRTWGLVKRFALTSRTDNWAKDLESVEQILFAPDAKTVYLTDWWNVWRSVDEGQSWVQVCNGLQNTVVNDIQFAQAQPGAIYLATDDNGLMVSKDDGRSWRRKMIGVADGHATAVRLSAKRPNVAYLLMMPWKSEDTGDSAFFHLYKSMDGCETWKRFRVHTKKKTFAKSFADGRATNLVIDPRQDDVVYVGTNGYGIFRVDTGQPVDAAGNAKAESISSGLLAPYLKGPGALVVNQANPNVMLAGTQEGGIFRTEDAGANWKLVWGSKSFVFGMAADPADPATVYAAAGEKKVLKSTDSGVTWQVMDLPGEHPPYVAAYSVAVSPYIPGTVLVGTFAYDLKAADGLYFSKDNGATFARIPSSLPRVGMTSLAAYSRDGALALVGFNGLGLFEVAPGK